MPRKKSAQNWERWHRNSTVEIAHWQGGIELRVPDDDGYKLSGWCKLIGGNVDVTVRRLLNEMGEGHRAKSD